MRNWKSNFLWTKLPSRHVTYGQLQDSWSSTESVSNTVISPGAACSQPRFYASKGRSSSQGLHLFSRKWRKGYEVPDGVCPHFKPSARNNNSTHVLTFYTAVSYKHVWHFVSHKYILFKCRLLISRHIMDFLSANGSFVSASQNSLRVVPRTMHNTISSVTRYRFSGACLSASK